MFVKELNSSISFLIKEATNLVEDTEVKVFHNLLCEAIVMCDDINKISDMFLNLLNKKIPYCLVDLNKLDYLIKVYLYE